MTPAALLLSSLLAAHADTKNPQSPAHVFIGGLGYCGARIALAFRDAYGPDGCTISGTVRSSERRDALLSSPPAWLSSGGGGVDGGGGDGPIGGGSVHVLDLDESYGGLSAEGAADLRRATHVVQTVAPIADCDRDPLLALHGDILRGSRNLRYAAYISSTGVYGDHGGEWVTEESELRCVDAKSRARVDAEREWGRLEAETGRGGGGPGPRVDLFRCGGIYGPGRGPLFLSVDSLEEAPAASGGEGTADAPPKYVNRVLVDDICGAILAAASADRPRFGGTGRAYNLVDDKPAPRRDVLAEARRLLAPNEATGGARAEKQSSVPKGASKRRRISRNTGNKRCDNSRLKKEYGWKTMAPTYKEGLALLMERKGL